MPSSGRCTTVASPPWRLMHGAKGRAISSRPLQLSIAPIVAWLVGDIAAVADDDGDAGQLFEIGGRYGVGGQRPERADGLHRLGCLTFGEYESAARLVGHYGAYVSAFDGRMPARPSALGVDDKDAAARFVHQRGHVQLYVQTTINEISRTRPLSEFSLFYRIREKLRSELEVDADKYIAKWKPIKELRERRATALSTLEIPEIDLQTYISNVKERNKQIELRRKL